MLKKFFITIVAATSLMLTATAQEIVPADDRVINVDDLDDPDPIVLKPYALSIGPKVGFNYSIAGDPKGLSIGMTGNAGFSAGAAFNVRFWRPSGRPFGTERLGVQVEALYSMRNLKTDIENISMNCFEIPVLVQWYFLPVLAVEVGPTFSGSFPSSPEKLGVGNSVYQLSEMKAFDVMLSVGLNCKLKNGFTADVRYNLGNSNMAGNFQTKVSTISVGIGWLFNVIK